MDKVGGVVVAAAEPIPVRRSRQLHFFSDLARKMSVLYAVLSFHL